eukprot:1820851-Rhodomonas_salina.1
MAQQPQVAPPERATRLLCAVRYSDTAYCCTEEAMRCPVLRYGTLVRVGKVLFSTDIGYGATAWICGARYGHGLCSLLSSYASAVRCAVLR